ncbi:MAG: hypothetical protein ABJF01_07540 [bacterium]
MPDLLVRIKKKTDGDAALSCIRADGTTTWQRQEGQLGRFFPLHDLTHYAVESVLMLRQAFFGLLAEGWDISDFGTPESRGKIPDDAGFAEMVVGCFDLERMTGMLGTADEYNERIATHSRDNGLPPTPFRLSDEQIARIRHLRSELFAKWTSLPPGDTLELTFERGAESAV